MQTEESVGFLGLGGSISLAEYRKQLCNYGGQVVLMR